MTALRLLMFCLGAAVAVVFAAALPAAAWAIEPLPQPKDAAAANGLPEL